jgi:hypothetical protein
MSRGDLGDKIYIRKLTVGGNGYKLTLINSPVSVSIDVHLLSLFLEVFSLIKTVEMNRSMH